MQWSVNLYNICCTEGECSEDSACTHSKSCAGITRSCWLWSLCIFKLSFWVVEWMISIFILFVFTMNYFKTQWQAQEPCDWMCATDQGYERCWQEETFAAATYLSCRCHLISNLTGVCSQSVIQNRWKAFGTLMLPGPVSYIHTYDDAPLSALLQSSCDAWCSCVCVGGFWMSPKERVWV